MSNFDTHTNKNKATSSYVYKHTIIKDQVFYKVFYNAMVSPKLLFIMQIKLKNSLYNILPISKITKHEYIP